MPFYLQQTTPIKIAVFSLLFRAINHGYSGKTYIMPDELLYKFFAPFWSAETSYAPGLWSGQNPSLGQCVPTALVIQDHLGGEIVRGTIHLKNGETERHYWNHLEDKNLNIDATRFQYTNRIIEIIQEDVRDLRTYVLENPDTARRYDLLKKIIPQEDAKIFFTSLFTSPRLSQ